MCEFSNLQTDILAAQLESSNYVLQNFIICRKWTGRQQSIATLLDDFVLKTQLASKFLFNTTTLHSIHKTARK